MIVKLLAAALLVAAPVPVSHIALTSYPAVRQVRCDEGRGSAVQVGSEWISAAHVASLRNCSIDGHPMTVIEKDGDNDFARIALRTNRRAPAPINCGGFIPGEYYWSVGYAHGEWYQTAVRLRATGFRHVTGMQILIGEHTVIPGMSGGAVFDSDGRVVGVVNAYNEFYGLSFSRALQDTSVCSKS